PHARDPEVLAEAGELDLEGLEDPEEAVDGAVPRLQLLDRAGELADVERIADPHGVVKEPGVVAARRIADHAQQTDVVERPDRAHEPERGLDRIGRHEDDVSHRDLLAGPYQSARTSPTLTDRRRPGGWATLAAIDVVFLAPTYPREMREYTRGLAEVGARVYGIGDTPPHELGELRRYLADYLQVPRIMDEDDVVARAGAWLRGRNVDRVLTNWEPLVVLAARVRERWELPGMGVEVARSFRDKQLMKERVAAAGLRVPRSARATTVATAREAAERIGFPLVLKPIAGAGSADTHRVDDAAGLEGALKRLGHVAEISVEEYVEGEEYTFDAISIGGRTVTENVAYYLPKPIVGRNEEWISPMTITVRDMARPDLAPGIALGREVLGAMGLVDGFSHMEWFLTPAGEAVFGEIGCRPPGAHLVDQINFTCDTDLFVEWARAMVWGTFEGQTERKYNCAMICKRAHGQGRIQRIEGLDDFRRRFSDSIVVEEFLPIGTPRRNWRQTLLG